MLDTCQMADLAADFCMTLHTVSAMSMLTHLHSGTSAYRAGDQEVQSEYTYTGTQEASPEDRGAVEGGALLNGEQQPSYRGCKGGGHPYSHTLCFFEHVIQG